MQRFGSDLERVGWTPQDLVALTEELAALSRTHKNSPNDGGNLQRKEILRLTRQINDEVQDARDRNEEYQEQMEEIGAPRLLVDWRRAFDHIPRHPETISYSELACRVDAEEPSASPNGMDARVKRRDPRGVWFKLAHDSGNFVFSRSCGYFAKYGRKNPTEPTHNPCAYAYGTEDKTFFEVIEGERLQDFNTTMQTLDFVLPIRGMFPFQWITENVHRVPDDTALVVDVGGGQEQALRQIMQECPDIPAERLVLQDLPSVIEDAKVGDFPELQGVQKMPHNFFEEQPVKGALVYYIRRVMHNWSDRNNCRILGHVRDVMSPASRILITEQVVANPPPPEATWLDLLMMGLGSKQRTEKDWYSLAGAAGLELVKIWKSPGTAVAVMELKKQ
ncbi:O-methyltransferase family 2 [Botryosphaeria dothidea]|uniref:O-methyltransferase family 2 n=1 Tax=Botryosphaeria dothidea TaxID=55169 RepID=A0A8H4IMN3_9PEZI|nr:O-methyltransferase family 2 [Botryosphaeria dothidea]